MRRVLLSVLVLAVLSSFAWAAADFDDSGKLANCYNITDTAVCSAQEKADSITFRREVQIAIVQVATEVAGESQVKDAGPPQALYTEEEWNKRAALASNILSVHFVGQDGSGNAVIVSGSEAWLQTFADGVAQNSTITSASNDGDIKFTINSIFSDVAGVRGSDLQ